MIPAGFEPITYSVFCWEYRKLGPPAIGLTLWRNNCPPVPGGAQLALLSLAGNGRRAGNGSSVSSFFYGRTALRKQIGGTKICRRKDVWQKIAGRKSLLT